MKKIVLIGLSTLVLATGCASVNDYDALRSDVDALQVQTNVVRLNAKAAKNTAQSANFQAGEALTAANNAEMQLKAVNDKIDGLLAE